MKTVLISLFCLLFVTACYRQSETFVHKLCKETPLSKVEKLPDSDTTSFECRIAEIVPSSPLADAFHKADKIVVGDETLRLLDNDNPVRAVYSSSDSGTTFSYSLKDDCLSATVLHAR